MDGLKGLFWKDNIEDYFLGHQLSEVYKDKVYEPFLKDKKDLIVDVGANIGVTSYYFAQKAKLVHSLEPSLEHFQCLAHMISYNQLDNVKAHKLAIYIKEDELVFYHNKNKTMNSLHTSVSDNTSPPERVKAVTLEKFFNDNKIEKCDLLKLDIEGTEIEVISSPGFTNIADRIDMVICEYHTWSQRPVSQLVEAFDIAGFKLEQIPNEASLYCARK
jgi:FkbM family methyltransferase